MGTILTVTFNQGEVLEQLFQLKVSALKNTDSPQLWRLTEDLLELALVSALKQSASHWPAGYVSESRPFGVPLDIVRDMPHLLCEDYVIYPYIVKKSVVLAH